MDSMTKKELDLTLENVQLKLTVLTLQARLAQAEFNQLKQVEAAVKLQLDAMTEAEKENGTVDVQS